MDATGVRQLIRLASYYHRFIRSIASIAQPFNTLTQKGASFRWTDEYQHVFEELKSILTTAPVLAYPKPQENFVIETDASNGRVPVRI